jgi:methenyltetrahydrofolate cyclohydrolase (EC 3.5.4.9)/Formate-tetrahydrofolate ligase (EC 6.3.4.3)/5,10-methylenetetrahydrofolate dehydrogenase (NADP+) (EC 1.5.1.5)
MAIWPDDRLSDMRERLGRIVVAGSRTGAPVTAEDWASPGP